MKTTPNYAQLALELHEKYKGKWEMRSKVPVKNRMDLSTAYTPGVAEPCLQINKKPQDCFKYTSRGNVVAVITDGTSILGLG